MKRRVVKMIIIEEEKLREIIRQNELLIQTAEHYERDTTPLQNIHAINNQLKEQIK